MRKTNCKCEVCGKALYRRPYELAKIRYVVCIEHRAEMQHRAEITEAQLEALKLGRVKGTNHLEGIPKSPESNRKRSESHKAWCAENPDKVVARAKKIRGDNHYLWNGAGLPLNRDINHSPKNRTWKKNIRERDGACRVCGSVKRLESHHIIPISVLVKKYKIETRKQAYECEEFWNLSNGLTLCRKCHGEVHGRVYVD